MLLALDVGNTETVVGVFSDDGPPPPRELPAGELTGLLHHWRIATVAERTSDEYALVLVELLGLVGLDLPRHEKETSDQTIPRIDGIAIASSVPQVTAALRETCRRWVDGPLVVVEPGVRTAMPVRYDNPKEVGADRIANAVGAIDLYGAPVIVVDLGTATTLDAVSSLGEYLGGAIAPGIAISMDALFAEAAALRRVELVAPRNVIGRSTVESMQAGAIFGHAGLVDGLCRRFLDELGPAKVIATGGLGGLVTPHSSYIEAYEPWLTLHGLRLIYGRNSTDTGHEAT